MNRLKQRTALVLSIALALTGCATSIVQGARTPCSDLIPVGWRDGVASATDPVIADDADALTALKAWAGFGVAQTGQLATANGRTIDAIGIVDRCEARDRQADAKTAKRWWQVWK